MKRFHAASGVLAAALAAGVLVAGCGAGGGQGAAASSSAQAPSSSAAAGKSSAASSSSSAPSSAASGAVQDQINAVLAKNPIKFDLMKSTLDDKSKQTLKQVAGILNKSKKTKVKVTGYVVPHSLQQQEAKKLSTARAESVAKELENDGVSKDRISTEGGGAGQSGASAKIMATG